jgi:hypothetical protein
MLLVPTVHARVTPNDIYQEKRATFEQNLSKIPTDKKEKIIQTDMLLSQINQEVCLGFDAEIARMSAILDQLKERKNITSTRVAYGNGSTLIENADYYLNYAQEAVAYQKIQDYTPQISGNLSTGVTSSLNNLTSDLGVLRNKILRAKGEINKALNEN